MKATGKTEWSAARESLYMPMETSMMDNGKTTLQMVKGYSFTLMGKNTSASGRTTISTDMVLRHGLMVPTMRDNIVMALRTGLEN